MADESSVADALQRWQSGDDAAAEELYTRYVERLRRLAESRLSRRLKQRVDADDILQTIFRTFFRRGSEGRFQLADSASLWRLLAAITLNKVRMKARFEQQAKRDFRVEVAISGVTDDDAFSIPVECFAAEPCDEDSATVTDLLQHVVEGLTERDVRILEVFAEGHSKTQIAELLGATRRTVQRVIELVAERLRREMAA